MLATHGRGRGYSKFQQVNDWDLQESKKVSLPAPVDQSITCPTGPVTPEIFSLKSSNNTSSFIYLMILSDQMLFVKDFTCASLEKKPRVALWAASPPPRCHCWESQSENVESASVRKGTAGCGSARLLTNQSAIPPRWSYPLRIEHCNPKMSMLTSPPMLKGLPNVQLQVTTGFKKAS